MGNFDDNPPVNPRIDYRISVNWPQSGIDDREETVGCGDEQALVEVTAHCYVTRKSRYHSM